MAFIIFNILIILTICFLLFLLSWFWPPDSPWAPWWRTNKKTAIAICKLAKITNKDIIYDLGCGDGEVLLQAAKQYKAKGVGIEIDPVRYWVAKSRMFFGGISKNVLIKRSNLFQENISKASVIVVYLVPKALNKLLPKFKKELKKGTRIVSYRYEINLPLQKYDRKNNLRLYTV